MVVPHVFRYFEIFRYFFFFFRRRRCYRKWTGPPTGFYMGKIWENLKIQSSDDENLVLKSKKRMFWKNAVFDAKFGVDTSKFYRNLEFGASAFERSLAASSTTRATEDFQITQRFKHQTAWFGCCDRCHRVCGWLERANLLSALCESRWN